MDAAQGEAQTMANLYLALEHNLEIIPVINKIDLPSAQPEHVKKEIEDVIGLDCSEAPEISAKNGLNVEAVLEQIVKHIPPPKGDEDAPLKALIFDSFYDSYKGVIVHIRVMEGSVRPGDTIRMMYTKKEFLVNEIGYVRPGQYTPATELLAGDVGYITASIKNVRDTRVGDTVTLADRPAAEPLAGYKKVLSMVFCGIYPADGARCDDLRCP